MTRQCQLPSEEQSVVKEVLDSFIIKYQTRRWDSTRAATPPKKAAAAKRQTTAHR